MQDPSRKWLGYVLTIASFQAFSQIRVRTAWFRLRIGKREDRGSPTLATPPPSLCLMRDWASWLIVAAAPEPAVAVRLPEVGRRRSMRPSSNWNRRVSTSRRRLAPSIGDFGHPPTEAQYPETAGRVPSLFPVMPPPPLAHGFASTLRPRGPCWSSTDILHDGDGLQRPAAQHGLGRPREGFPVDDSVPFSTCTLLGIRSAQSSRRASSLSKDVPSPALRRRPCPEH